MFKRLFSKSGLSLERLRTFCEVADAGSMAKAANGDTVRQSQFSRQMKDLEEHFGRKLTERNGRNVVLTKDGKELAALARGFLIALEDFQQADTGAMIEISLGAGESFHRGVILPRLARIKERLPNVTLALRNMRSAEIVAALLDGKMDLGVIESEELTGNLASDGLGRLGYRLIANKGRGKTSAAVSPDLAKVLRMPFAGMEGNGRIMAAVEAMAAKEGVALNYLVKCASWQGVADALQHHDCAAILPNVIDVPDNCRIISATGLKAFERSLVLAWDARRGNLRPQSNSCQRVLGDVLRLSDV